MRLLVQHEEIGFAWDQPEHELPSGMFSDGENVTLIEHRYRRYGGFRADIPLANARALFEIQVSGNDYLVRVTSTAIEISGDLQAWTDVTPAGGIQDSAEWLLTQLGDWLFISHIGEQPYVYKINGTRFEAFTNWPANETCAKIVAFQNILVAVGVRRTGTVVSGLVKWSDSLGDQSTIESVEWSASPTNLAGEYTIATADGPILDALVLRNSLMLYLDRSVWRQDLTSTTLDGIRQVFAFRPVFETQGILRARCVVEYAGRHYVTGKDDIYVTDGNTKQTIGHDRVTKRFFARLGAKGFAFMHHVPQTQEIYLMYARADHDYASSGLVYSYLYDAWTPLELTDAQGSTQGFASHAALGPVVAAQQTPLTYDTAPGTYNDYNDITYAGQFANQRERILYVLSPSMGQIYAAGQPAESSDIVLSMRLERIDLDLDEYIGTTGLVKYISRIYPHLSGKGDVFIEVGGRNSLQGSVTWQAPRVFAEGDYKYDCRMSFRYPAFRVTQNGNGSAEWSGMQIDVSRTYGR